jgi:pyruvate formate lyase activating enzyme
MNVNEIMNEVIKDSKYFQQSGGGITISGGEPLAQPQFIKVLLREAKKSGINTCIETSGYASNKIFREVISIADHIIFDLKANASKHRSLTGASNKLINENFKFLLDEKIPFELRCPLIEGVNDDDEHLQNISKIANGNIHVKVRIMPYHNTGLAKNARFGYEPSMAFLESSSEMVKNSWKQRISNFGSNKVSIGF